jgi:hypothetical protein
MAQLHAPKSNAFHTAHLRHPRLRLGLLCRAVPGGPDRDHGQRSTVSFRKTKLLSCKMKSTDRMIHVETVFYYQLFLLNFCFASELAYLTNTLHIQHLSDCKAWYEAQTGRTSAFIHTPQIYYTSWQYPLLHNRVRSQGTRGGCRCQEVARTGNSLLYSESAYFNIDLRPFSDHKRKR